VPEKSNEGNIFGTLIFLVILFIVAGIAYNWFDGIFNWINKLNSFNLFDWIITIFLLLILIFIVFLIIGIASKFVENSSSNIEYKIDKPSTRKKPSPEIPTLEKDRYTLEDIDEMKGWVFEEFLKKLFEKMGYSVNLTPDSNDYGADLILSKSGERISVQAKRWDENVGRKAVQEVYSSEAHWKTQRGIVVCNSYFTNNAIILADSCKVELWNRDKLEKMLNKYPIYK
jgi:restriction system protein